MALLGHVIRREPEELIRRVPIDENLRRPSQHYKRVAATGLNWVTDNLHRAHAPHREEEYDLAFDQNDPEHVANLIDKAFKYGF